MRAKPPSPKRSRAWKARRQKAERLFALGVRQASVARKLGLSRQCVHNWFRQWSGDGFGRSLGRPGSGRKSKLDGDDWTQIDAALRQGPRACGFKCERWTLERVAQLIERISGIRYHP